ncbi:MAG: hypothetical protein JNM68_15405, partial [Dinghuibacter sp.]|nr:hypothetical protein [Dinghuibacter sp.]
MIQYLSERKKQVAHAMFWVFYLGLLAPLYATGKPVEQYGNVRQVPLTGTTTARVPVAGNAVQNTLPPMYLPVPVQKTGAERKLPYRPLDGPGPGQPEMQAFKAVGANDMVDLFTGDFSYNIPLLDVGGYPVNLSYNG